MFFYSIDTNKIKKKIVSLFIYFKVNLSVIELSMFFFKPVKNKYKRVILYNFFQKKQRK